MVNILAAGTETTTHLLSVGLLTLLRHPTEMARLCEDMSLSSNSFEENRRYGSPVQMAFVRLAPTSTTIGGSVLDAGTVVAALIG